MIKNAIKQLLRYRKFTLLNTLGLTVAFTVAYVFFTAAIFDLTFNDGIKDSDEIFVVTYKHADISPGKLPSAMVRMLVDDNPYVENYHYGPSMVVQQYYDSNGEEEYLFSGEYTRKTVDMLGVQLLDGDWNFVYEHGAIALNTTTADELGVKVGDDIVLKVDDGRKNIMVGAIFDDFPKNSDFRDINSIVRKSYDPEYYDSSDWQMLLVFLMVKLNDDADKDDFLSVFSRRLADNRPDEPIIEGMTPDNVAEKFDLLPLTDSTRLPEVFFHRTDIAKSYIYLSISLLILAIAFINFFNMFVALVPRRIRSINTQKVFGASTAGLRLELAIEALLLVAGAMLLSGGIITLLEDYELVINDFGTYSPFVNSDAALLLLSVILAGTLLVTAYPLWYITSFQPAFVLKGHFGSSPVGKMLRNTLIGLQFVVSFVFVTVTLLINRQYDFMCNQDLGVDFKNTYIGSVSYHLDHPVTQSMLPELRDALMSHPQIVDVTFSQSLYSSERVGKMRFLDLQNEEKRDITINAYRVSRNFLDFLKVDIVEGRNLNETNENIGRCVVFNETARDMLGIKVGDVVYGYLTVGFCRDFHQESVQQEIIPSGYFCGPLQAEADLFSGCYIRTTDDCNFSSLYEHFKNELKAIQPMTPEAVFLNDFKTWNEHNWYSSELAWMRVMFLASLISIMVSLLGVFGLIAYETEYRSREIAIRRVNGATVGEILSLFNCRFIRILALCFAVSLPLSVYAMNLWLLEFKSKVPFSPTPYLLSFLLVSVVTILVVTLSAWRVVNRNPVEVLGKE